jgi:SNF2 family DNA or RNA helicase
MKGLIPAPPVSEFGLMTELPPLRPYQEEAIDQALSRGSLLLAMTMGSGKTRTAIESVERLFGEGKILAGSVFVQNSTKFQWKREIEYWSSATVNVIDGDRKARATQYRKAYKYRYNILNYEALVHDWDLIQKYLPIDFVIADEVTNIKSFKAKKSRHLKALGKHTEYRFGMSGQPVENRPEELFSIMEFVDPEVLGPFHKFDRTFISRDNWGRPKFYKNLDTLATALTESMFRRSRADIAEFLPKILTLVTPVTLDLWSQALYDEIKVDLIDLIDMALAAGMGGFDLMSHYGRGDDESSNQFKGLIMSRVTAMRLLCGHPSLLLKSADDFDDESIAGGSQYAASLKEAGRLDKAPTSSNKLTALMDTVNEVLSEDPFNKVVIFSGFKAMLAIISGELRKAKYGHTLLSGDVPSKVRDERIVKFNTDYSCRVFLSSDAGAYGVNLDAGTHLISYDLPWSAGSYAQRIARIDRTSSQHSGIIIDSMFAKNTIEERQYEMLIQKRKISEAFIDGQFDEKGQLALDLSSLKEFLLNS